MTYVTRGVFGAASLLLLLSAMAVEMLISGLHRACPALAPIAAQ